MRYATIVALLATFALCRAADVSIELDHTNGVYHLHDTIHWTIQWKGQDEAPAAQYRLLKGGWTDAARGELNFSNNFARLDTTPDRPDTFLLEVKWPRDNPKHRALSGAVAGAAQIRPAATAPDDFNSFWKSKLRELDRVPVHPDLQPVDIGKTNVAYWKIKMDNIRGTHIQGQLARPVKGEKFPALLIVQWAGVYPLELGWAVDRAAEGWLTLNIEAHDLPIDKPREFYKEQSEGALKNYPEIGNDDRETSYFLRMYLSCYRAVEYLAHRPDWNGKTLVVMGTSQGGLQTLMTAGFHPDKITAALALVPAGCDMLAPQVGRAPGWPQWYLHTQGKDAQKVHEASRYYDVANFTPHIRCPILVGMGLIDETCPPSSVLAAFNEISSPKELVILPHSGHQDEHGTQAAYQNRCYNGWLPVLRQGKSAPVQIDPGL